MKAERGLSRIVSKPPINQMAVTRLMADVVRRPTKLILANPTGEPRRVTNYTPRQPRLVKERTHTVNEIVALVVTAPAEPRETHDGLSYPGFRHTVRQPPSRSPG